MADDDQVDAGSTESGAAHARISSQIWAGIGKAAVLISMIGGLIGIVRSCSSDLDLEATGEYALMQFPRGWKAQFRLADEDSLQRHAEKLLAALTVVVASQPAVSPAARYPGSQPSEIAKRIGEWLTEYYPADLRELLDTADGIAWIRVNNEGRSAVSGLELQVPRHGWYHVSRPGQPDQFAQFDSVVPLGSLKPGTAVSLTLWMTMQLSPYSEDAVRLIHTRGTANVSFPAPVTGPLAWLFRKDSLVAFLVWPVIAFAIVATVVNWMTPLVKHICGNDGAKEDPKEKGGTTNPGQILDSDESSDATS